MHATAMHECSNGAANTQQPVTSLIDHFADVNIHGVSYIYKSRNCALKLFWVLVVAAAFSVAIYLTVMTVRNYFSSPKVSKIMYTPSRNLNYPVITVCDQTNNYFLNRTKLKADNVSDEAVQMMLLSGPVWFLSRSAIPDWQKVNVPHARQFYARMREEFGGAATDALQGFFSRYGVSCEALFHSCRDANFARIDCCRLFRLVANFQHGLCFATNFAELRVAAAGIFSNFFVKFNALDDLWSSPQQQQEQQDERVARYRRQVGMDPRSQTGPNNAPSILGQLAPWATRDQNQNSTTESDLQTNQDLKNATSSETPACFCQPPPEEKLNELSISISTGISQGMWKADNVILRPGSWDIIRLSISRISMERRPGYECVNEPKLLHFADYTFANCMWEKSLLQNRQFQTPNKCLLPMSFLTKLGTRFAFDKPASSLTELRSFDQSLDLSGLDLDRPLCRPEDIMYYVFNFTGRNVGSSSSGNFESIVYWMDRLKMTSNYLCAPACDHWEYKFTEQNSVLSDPSKSTSGFTLTVIDYEYPTIQEVPAMNWFEYVALVGGVWGLWVGTSIITSIQLVYSFLLTLCKACRDLPQRSTTF